MQFFNCKFQVMYTKNPIIVLILYFDYSWRRDGTLDEPKRMYHNTKNNK